MNDAYAHSDIFMLGGSMTDEKTIPLKMHEAGPLCACKHCPTYFDCGEPLAFCLFDGDATSKCITVERGCICPGCTVYRELQFDLDFYCTKGSEDSQKTLRR